MLAEQGDLATVVRHMGPGVNRGPLHWLRQLTLAERHNLRLTPENGRSAARGQMIISVFSASWVSCADLAHQYGRYSFV